VSGDPHLDGGAEEFAAEIALGLLLTEFGRRGLPKAWRPGNPPSALSRS
jgi:hypothetical protein